jgi:glycosyltransferase involved in cell wall biosynthesis
MPHAKATVLVDGTLLNRRLKGIGRYAWQICVALSRDLPKETDLVVVVFEGELPDFPPGFRARFHRIPFSYEVTLGLWVFPRLIRDLGASVFIRPADKIGRRYAVPTLTVCHDLDSMIFAHLTKRSVGRRMLDWFWIKLRGHGLRQSDKVVCNSKFIQEAAIADYRLSPEKTSVGYCGVDARIFDLADKTDRQEVKAALKTNAFVLAFATGDEREGFDILPNLWQAAKRAGYPGKLVVAGVSETAGYTKELKDAFRDHGVSEEVIVIPFLGEGELKRLVGLYSAADFYLETSRHEGFGMQLVEAMACGTPCFSSERGALKEVGGGFPLVLEIDNPADAGKALANAWHTGLHKRDNTASKNWARGFSWGSACVQVVDFSRASARELLFEEPAVTP